MKNSEKIQYIFQTGRRARMHLENKVFQLQDSKKSLLSELSAVQMKVAMQIQQSEPMSLSDLAKKLNLSNPSASVIVEKLVEKKVVSRDTDPRDRRRVQLRIHPKASKEMQSLQNRLQQAFAEIAGKVGAENLDRWFMVAERINEILEEEGANI